MAIVYQHRRLDTNELFYIGVELDTHKKKAIGKRSKEKFNRSQFWKNITNNISYEIEILFDNITNEEAFQIEEYLIRYYGRRDLKLGPLVNLTFGGEGTFGFVYNEETRKKMSLSQIGKT